MFDEVREICSIDNAIIRNLRITDCYHRLSSKFAQRVGPGANWCTFATWASKQAGSTIRGEDIIEHIDPTTPRIWRWLLHKGLLNPRTTVGWTIRHLHTPFDAVERASRSVAEGNLKIFEEIGAVFAQWLADPAFEPSAPLLREAFAHYNEAAVEHDPDRRARLLLFGNIKCGWHEQTQLQPEIVEAMKSPLGTANALTRRFLPFLHPPVERFTARLEDLTCRIVTHGFMSLKLPDRRLRLGADLGLPIPGCFQGIEKDELIAQFDLAGSHGEGAENWADLSQRMRYIAMLFRCLHHDRTIFQPPFKLEQVIAMRSGRIPRGRL